MPTTLNPNGKLLVIIPAYNESGNIRTVLRELEGLNLDLSIIVINDCSNDDTAEKVRDFCRENPRNNIFLASLPFNLGIGGAVQAGFQYAYCHGFDMAVQVDGDGQHDSSFLMALIEPVCEGKADMSIGSRFIPPFTSYRSSFIRKIGIHFFSKLLSLLTRQSITDPTSGFRAFNRKLIEIFADYYPHDFPEPEAIMIARRFSAKIVEVPVQMRKRAAGFSSIRYVKTLYYMIKVTFAILLDMLKAKRRQSKTGSGIC